jgi:hypothetical protein
MRDGLIWNECNNWAETRRNFPARKQEPEEVNWRSLREAMTGSASNNRRSQSQASFPARHLKLLDSFSAHDQTLTR